MAIKPDTLWHAKRLVRQVAYDLANRARRVDIRALAASWEIKGVDLSYWNGAVDFEKLKTMVDFAILRAGYGNDYFDPRVDEYRAGCEAVGLPFGLYWYPVAGKNWAAAALNFYRKWFEKSGVIYPIFDLEDNGGLGKTELESWWLKCYNEFNRLSGLAYPKEATYTSPGFLDGAIALTNWMKWTNLWVAHWTSADQPQLPREWSVPGKPWKFWQWSAVGRGADYGISSHYVDLERYNGTRVQFNAEFGMSVPPPPPPPEPPPPADVIVPIGSFTVSSTYRNLRGSIYGPLIGNVKQNSIIPYVDEEGEWVHLDAWVWKSPNE